MHKPPASYNRILHYVALGFVIIIGALLRFSHADWDGGNQLHPDERAILFVASQMHLPDSVGQALDVPHSPLNPFRNRDGSEHQYPYGHLPLYIILIASRGLALPCQHSDACDPISPATFAGRLLNVANASTYVHLTYVGRALSALFDSLTLVTLFFLGSRLFHRAAGILAAALGSLAVLHIQNAHFGTVDSALSLFATLTLLFLVRYTETRAKRDSILAGVCMGLAFGCKATAILLIVPMFAAYISFTPRTNNLLQAAQIQDTTRVRLTLACAALAFAVTNPYAIIDPIPYLTSVSIQAEVTSSGADWPFTRQYLGTILLVYPIEQQARWFLGVPLTLAIYAGLLYWVWNAWKTRARALIVVLAWILILFLTVGVQHVKFPRYFLPATPALFILAAGLLSLKVEATVHRWVQGGVIASILLLTGAHAVAFTRMYDAPHPWIAASQWIYRELPPRTIILSEKWDDPLPLDLEIDGVSYLREAFVASRLIDPFAEPDDESKLSSISAELAAADYIILSSNRLYGVIPRLEERYPLTSAYYRALFSGDIGYVIDRTFSRYPHSFSIALIDDPLLWPDLPAPGNMWPENAIRMGRADESYSVYDHPLVVVFRNEARFTAEQITAAIMHESDR
jgi:hypothetical protein